MSDLIDPIVFLRDAFNKKGEINLGEQGKDLIFKSIDGGQPLRIPLNVPTAWALGDNKGGYYTLGSLWFWVVNRDQKPSDYMKKASNEGIPPILYNDRDNVKDYFMGIVPTAASIDDRVRSSTLIKRSHIIAGKVQIA